jgi:glycosyltransferase involved in cell wall biosynthesis
MARLSICIPGYNRPAFLHWTIERLMRDFPKAEIIVSDDCSTEDMMHARNHCVFYGVRWIQQSHNIGPFPNMLAAFEAATGDYAIYCANDDYLLPERVHEAIRYLDAHPEIASYTAPCEVWDEINQKTYWNAYTAPEATFTKADGMRLFNFMIGHHVWPEHMIHRTPIALKRRGREYWAFADIPDILAAGSLHFSPVPFYRNLLVHPVGMRTQLGNEQALTHFDEYRGGLELMACGLLGDKLPYKARAQVNRMIQSFICTRLLCAQRLYAQAGYEWEAERIRQRLAIADPRDDIQQTEAA